MPLRSRIPVGILAVTWLLVSVDASGQSLSRDATEEFLRTAEVVNAEPVGSGTTFPWRLTLSDGTTTHDALFQTVEDRRPIGRLANGQVVLNFADSFEFNIAAYRLAKLVGLGHMIPVTVRRQWRDEEGAFSWWVDDVMLDERQRLEQKIEPPNPGMWQAQLFNMRVFAQLVNDTDRNQGNVLYTDQWRLWMIDFTRAFTISEEIRDIDHLVRVDRSLFRRLQDPRPRCGASGAGAKSHWSGNRGVAEAVRENHPTRRGLYRRTRRRQHFVLTRAGSSQAKCGRDPEGRT